MNKGKHKQCTSCKVSKSHDNFPKGGPVCRTCLTSPMYMPGNVGYSLGSANSDSRTIPGSGGQDDDDSGSQC